MAAVLGAAALIPQCPPSGRALVRLAWVVGLRSDPPLRVAQDAGACVAPRAPATARPRRRHRCESELELVSKLAVCKSTKHLPHGHERGDRRWPSLPC